MNEQEKEITVTDLRALKRHLQEKIKEFKRIGENYYNDDFIKARCNLKVVEEELIRKIALEKELKKTFIEAKKEKELQEIPYLTRRYSYLKTDIEGQNARILQWMLEHEGRGERWQIVDDTGMLASSVGRALTTLKKSGHIKPCSIKIGKYKRPVTVYAVVSEQ